jgi:glycerate 2-kinase
VRGDALYEIGSGPASADPTDFAAARDVLERHGAWSELPAPVRTRIERGVAGAVPETLKPGDPLLARASGRVVASLRVALEAAQRAAEARGWRVRLLPGALDGDVESVALALADEVAAARASDCDLVLAGGEPTVRVRGGGRGGRAQELALRLALACEGRADFAALCAGTDGTDGPTTAAGAFSDGSTLARAQSLRLDVRAALSRSDSHEALGALGDLYRTGPTETNVGDLALVRLPRRATGG